MAKIDKVRLDEYEPDRAILRANGLVVDVIADEDGTSLYIEVYSYDSRVGVAHVENASLDHRHPAINVRLVPEGGDFDRVVRVQKGAMTDILVVDARTGAQLPGIPTPRLIQTGGGEAYFSPNEDERSRERIPGVWYLRVDGLYTSPNGQYTRVRIVDTDHEGDEAFHVRMAARGQTDPEGELAAIDARYHDHLPEGQNCRLCGTHHAPINSREA